LQIAVLGVFTQPVVWLHESFVQILLSLQFLAVPARQVPLKQMSFSEHALPSLQGLLLLVKTQPVSGLQESAPATSPVQSLPSSQTRGAPPHTPPPHTSLMVQALLSLQLAVFGA
jgi:hypothetical protein